MSWLKQILCFLQGVLGVEPPKPRPRFESRGWRNLERKQVNEALKDKKYDDS